MNAPRGEGGAGGYTQNAMRSPGASRRGPPPPPVLVVPPPTAVADTQAPTVAAVAQVSPGTVTGTTAALTALGADNGGEAGLTYTWSVTGSDPQAGTPPAAVDFSANGTNAAKATTV